VKVNELIEILKEFNQDMPVIMLMDWTALNNTPEELKGQWEDDLDGALEVNNRLVLINKHFK
jgi:hypothetical protein